MLKNILIFIYALTMSFFMSVPVGPVGILSIRRTLERGLLSGLVVGLGAAFSDAIYASVIAFHLDTIFSFLIQYRLYLQFIGIFVLTLIGIKSFSSSLPDRRENFFAHSSLFTKAFFINITNPSIIFSFGALILIFHLDTFFQTSVQSSFFVLGVFVGSVLWWLVLGFTASRFFRTRNRDLLLYIHKGTGVLFLVFAGILSLSTFWEVFLR